MTILASILYVVELKRSTLTFTAASLRLTSSNSSSSNFFLETRIYKHHVNGLPNCYHGNKQAIPY